MLFHGDCLENECDCHGETFMLIRILLPVIAIAASLETYGQALEHLCLSACFFHKASNQPRLPK